MYNLIIDFSILVDFFLSKPLDIFEGGTIEEQTYWNSLGQFLKSGANVEIINFDDTNKLVLPLINNLTSGRVTTSIKINDHFTKPYKNTFNITNIFTICFLVEHDEKEILKFKKNNPFLICFNQEYKSVWQKLSRVNHRKTIPIRKISTEGLQKMSDLESIFLKTSDVILFDNYILDFNLMDSNLIPILESLYKFSNNHLNVLIISNEYTVKKPIKECYDLLLNKLKEKKIQVNLCLIFTQSKLKEHDRHLIFNHFRIKAGDSFNFFDSQGKIITKGTELDIYPLIEKTNFENTFILINKAKKIVTESPTENIIGNCKNRLITSTI
jgi:hypothetical protein